MFAELVCGPPGSGKTTYCEGKRQFLQSYDPARPVIMMNLDPANDGAFPYPCDVDIRLLVDHSVVMEEEGLGPNGSYLFCLDLIGQRLDWLEQEITKFVEMRMGEKEQQHGSHGKVKRAPYLIIDCPGQVEFYLNTDSMHKFVTTLLQRKLHCASVCMVHLTDGVVATRDVPTYISTCLLSLTSMVDLELPHVNVLTKWDVVLENEGGSPDSEGFLDVEAFLDTPSFLDHHFARLWKKRGSHLGMVGGLKERSAPPAEGTTAGTSPTATARSSSGASNTLLTMSKTIMEVVDGYGIVGFVPLDVQSQDMMLELVQRVDNALGNLV